MVEGGIERFVLFPHVIVLSPSRELVKQTAVAFHKLSWNVLKIEHIVGGLDVNEQRERLRRTQPDIIVATPGRLSLFLDIHVLNPSKCVLVVLDEADQMLELGFSKALEKFFNFLSSNTKIMMWTATWPKGAAHIAKKFLSNNAFRIRVKRFPNSNLTHITEFYEDHENKYQRILSLYQEGIITKTKKVLIFAKLKMHVKTLFTRLSKDLAKDEISVRSIHGNMTQSLRHSSMKAFHENSCSLLIASDMLSRGIDTSIDIIINFDIPSEFDRFLHRIGRTGRVGRTGIVYNFVDQTTKGSILVHFLTFLKKTKQNIPKSLLDWAKTAVAMRQKEYKRFAEDADEKKKARIESNDKPQYMVGLKAPGSVFISKHQSTKLRQFSSTLKTVSSCRTSKVSPLIKL